VKYGELGRRMADLEIQMEICRRRDARRSEQEEMEHESEKGHEVGCAR
jgi:hypothetical protein